MRRSKSIVASKLKEQDTFEIEKLRIIQNTTEFTNDKIKYIIQLVDPLLVPEFDSFKLTPLNLRIRIIYESQRDNEFLDNNCLGSYIPERFYINKHGFRCVEKAIISIILPDPTSIKFPSYSNFATIEYAESKGVPITKELIKELRQATMKEGNVIIVLLSSEENLVFTIAHELRHHWQYITPLGKLCNKSKIEQEKDANSYAIKQVRLWRKLHSPKDAYSDTKFMYECGSN
jgi:hypothetical protein